MEIIVRKVGEFIGEKAKETFGAKKDLIKLILAVIGCIVAAAAIAVIVVNIVNRLLDLDLFAVLQHLYIKRKRLKLLKEYLE